MSPKPAPWCDNCHGLGLIQEGLELHYCRCEAGRQARARNTHPAQGGRTT